MRGSPGTPQDQGPAPGHRQRPRGWRGDRQPVPTPWGSLPQLETPTRGLVGFFLSYFKLKKKYIMHINIYIYYIYGKMLFFSFLLLAGGVVGLG